MPSAAMPSATCRFDGKSLKHIFADLGSTPLANSYLMPDQMDRAEKFYPLRAYVCEDCLLVQLEEFESPDQIFNDYAYFSSYSDSWLHHAETYAEMMVARFGFDHRSLVVELASNDGYLLQYFARRDIPVLGVDPAANVALAAEAKGIRTLVKFFGSETARRMSAEGWQADLIVGNNVLAHVPDTRDFIAGMKILLKQEGIFTMEFPHLLRLIAQHQFDTIYHEHFSYFSFTTVERIFASLGLTLFDVEELPTHGGSLRIFGRHSETAIHAVTPRVGQLKAKEARAGLDRLETYLRFGEKVKETKRGLLSFLIKAKAEGKTIVGYGAPAKGNTLLNYCGVRTDVIDYTVDRSPHKQGLYLPGTRIPIEHPDKIKATRPDYILILPWNLKDEIAAQMGHVSEWGGKFIVPIPEVQVFS
jgi:SAM-dependent methyltransferase